MRVYNVAGVVFCIVQLLCVRCLLVLVCFVGLQQAMHYKEESEILWKQLQCAQEMNANLRREVAELHRAIETLTQPQSNGGPRSGLHHHQHRHHHRHPMSCTSSTVCSPQGV